MAKESVMKGLWFKVMSGIIVFVIVGVMSFVGARMTRAFDKVSKNYIEIELIKKDIDGAIDDIDKNTSTISQMDASLDRLNILVTRLETIVERLEGR